MCLVDPNKVWPGFTFTQSGFSKSCWVCFPQPCVTNIAMGFVSLGLENIQTYVPRFPQPSGPNQNLTCVYFPSGCLLKNYWCPFCSASRNQHIYMIRFPWPGPPLTSSSLSPPSKPKNWMRDLSEPNKIWPGFTFTQPGFSKTCWVHFPQLHGTNVYRRVVSLGLESPTKYVPRFPWTSGPKLDMVYFPSAWFLKNLLGYVSLSFTASTCREESFHLALGT